MLLIERGKYVFVFHYYFAEIKKEASSPVREICPEPIPVTNTAFAGEF